MNERVRRRASPRNKRASVYDERELARQMYAERHNPAGATGRRVEIESRPSGMQVVSFRLPTGEFRLLVRAARQARESLSEYVRRALAMRLGLVVTVGRIDATWGSHAAGGTATFASPTAIVMLGATATRNDARPSTLIPVH